LAQVFAQATVATLRLLIDHDTWSQLFASML